MKIYNYNYDVIVVGAGHAGIESALVAARMNKKTLLITIDKNKIAIMPCNPAIGGPAKGIVVREIDAIGGEMARITDKSALQIKLLNSSKGPAVWALRAQIDKIVYSKNMQYIIENQINLDILEGIVEKLLINKKNECYGVYIKSKNILGKKIILTTGTYMKSLILYGDIKKQEGPDNSITTNNISKQLLYFGIKLLRFKTGTPARIKKTSINFDKTQPELGTNLPLTFSYSTKKHLKFKNQEICWLIYSNQKTHKIVKDNITKSAMYSRNTQSKGPRYCPSFEDKIIRFFDKPRHQIFLEPESKFLDTIYVQGFSTSMPINIQDKMLRSLPGLENCIVDKWAYAIEYDVIDPTQMYHTLESKIIKNFFHAGQINGTSGYEEAACQGLMAGINASLSIDNKKPFILKRNEAYIGVLIDDLVTKGTEEPYRLLTSRAEYRLLLRNDNAEERLKKYAYQFNLINNKQWNTYQNDEKKYQLVVNLLKNTIYQKKSKFIINLQKKNIYIKHKISLFNLLKRSDINIKWIEKEIKILKKLKWILKQKLLINIRYKSYILKEKKIANQILKLENKKIPSNLNYIKIHNLSLEAIEKLNKIKPVSIGQAYRISGINSTDIQVLLFYLKKNISNMLKGE